MKSYKLSHLQLLESEAIYIMREVAAMFERPVLLFSGGKDSICLVRLAQRAFAPGKIPFPLMHVDTGHNFPEAIEFRDRMVQEVGAKLIVRSVQDSIDKGRATEEKGPNASRNALQTVTLLDAIEEFRFDACFGGARRDEEKARAKERVFSHRNEFGQWDPKNQRPELWNLYNGRKNAGENFRVFPLSNWTELDVWQYILREQLDLPSIYFTHKREVVDRKGMLLAKSDFIGLLKGEHYEDMQIRFRTVGDMTCTGAVVSNADSIEDIIREVASARVTERGGRSDDKRSDSAMEDRKAQGYF
ncbi:MAG: sulfate adenylyltransferase subunit CysD [Gammaproteobacteria bacterium]|nr:sulfate adenylyltransferase subunit CysD [Gammaproteobacteria bacterium]